VRRNFGFGIPRQFLPLGVALYCFSVLRVAGLNLFAESRATCAEQIGMVPWPGPGPLPPALLLIPLGAALNEAFDARLITVFGVVLFATSNFMKHL